MQMVVMTAGHQQSKATLIFCKAMIAYDKGKPIAR